MQPKSSRRYVALLFLICAGCSSISSTLLTRDGLNLGWERHPPLKGIPITLNVPTHLKVYVFDKHYLGIQKIGADEVLLPVDTGIPIRDFSHELLYTDKIFTVDFKRPGAGSSNLRLDMSNKQYFEKIQHDVTDETIARVADLFGAVFGMDAISPVTPAGGPLPGKPDIKELRSVVAVGVFEVNAPDFDEQVMAFLNCHLNKSHDAWVVPPDTDPVKRVGINVEGNLEVLHPEMPYCPTGDCKY